MTLGLLVRKVKIEDREPILAIHEAAFGQPDEANIVKRLWDDRAVRVERVAEIGGAVVGHIAYSLVTATPAIEGLLLGLAPLAVAPAHQQQGVGAALMNESLAACKNNKARLIVVLGDPSYYSRFGFTPASARKMRWDAADAGDAFQLIADEGNDFGVDRTVRYHDAFYDEG